MAGLVLDMVRLAPRQAANVAVLMTLASATEGVSLLLLVPLLRLIDPRAPSARIAIPTGPAAPWLGPAISLGLTTVLVGFVLMITIRAVLVRHKDIATAAFLYDLMNRLRDDLFLAVSRARWAFLAQLRGSDVNHALTADIDRVQMGASQILQLLQTAVVLAIYAAIALVLSPTMTAVALVTGGVLVLMMSPVRRMALRYGATLTGQRQEQYRIVTEFLSGLKIAKASNTEPLYVGQLSDTLRDMRGATLHFMRLYTVSTLLFQIGTAAGLALFIAIAARHLSIDFSAILTLVLLFVRIGPRVAAIHGSMQAVLTNLPALTAMRALQADCIAHAEVMLPGGAPLPPLREAIILDHVRFGYGVPGTPLVLQDISFTVRANEVTAIVGPSGSGKSTLADILMGLLEPSSGGITIDGAPLTADNRRAWRDQLAYVPQDSFLLHDTVAANLRLGRTDLPDQRLWDALEQANAAGFVRRLPDALATVVGDRGVRLSGGERQRVALARALLRDPRLLVLDEATSALDWESQAAIAQSIRGLRGRTTVITIAHRPSMIAYADWLVAISDARVIESGSFADLSGKADSYLTRLLSADR